MFPLFLVIASFVGNGALVCSPYSETPVTLPPKQIPINAATILIHVPVIPPLGSSHTSPSPPDAQVGKFDCSSGAIVSEQEPPSYSPEPRIRACIVPESGYEPN